jgi:hypothetical protein
MNLILSYGAVDDDILHKKGFKFLGAAEDKDDMEVHVFELLSLEDYQSTHNPNVLKFISETSHEIHSCRKTK